MPYLDDDAHHTNAQQDVMDASSVFNDFSRNKTAGVSNAAQESRDSIVTSKSSSQNGSSSMILNL